MNMQERLALSPGLKRLLMAVAAVSLVGPIGLLAANDPVLAMAVAVGALAGLAILAKPDMATLLVMGLLYSNATVVAMRFHRLPSIMAAALPVLLLIPVVNAVVFKRQKVAVDPIAPLLLVFLGVQVLGLAVASDQVTALDSVLTFLLEGCVLYMLVLNAVRSMNSARAAIWGMLIAGAFLGSLSLYQQLTQTFDNNYGGFAQLSMASFGTGVESVAGEVEQPRLAGPLGDQNYYAQFMLMLVPLGLFRVWGERTPGLRVAALAATVLIALGTALTFSRGAAVGFVLMLAIMTALRYIKLYQLALVGVALWAVLQALPQYTTRLDTLQVLSGVVGAEDTAGITAADSSVKSRLTEMGAAGLVFADHPVLGVGPGLFKYYYPDYAEAVGLRAHAGPRAAHNLFLGLAAEYGGLGLLCFSLIVGVTLHRLARLRRRTLQSHPELANMATGCLLMIVTYLTTGLFLSFAYQRYFWLVMAVAGAVTYNVGQSLLDDRPAPTTTAMETV